MAQGTITLTNGSTAVTGAGTDFTTIGSGDFITTTIGGVPYTIAVGAVGSATALTLAIPFDGPTAAGLAFENTGVNTMALATMGVTVQAQKALRFLIADEANWRKIFSNDQQITITTPGGQQITGISWGYLSTLLQNVDPALMAQQAQQAQDGAQQAIAANNAAQQAKTNAETAATNASNANNSAQTAATNASNANNSAQTAKTGAETARDQAEQFANSVNPTNLLHKDQNLSDLGDRAAAWLNVRPIGATPLAADPVADLDAVTRGWCLGKMENPLFANNATSMHKETKLPTGATAGGYFASSLYEGNNEIAVGTYSIAYTKGTPTAVTRLITAIRAASGYPAKSSTFAHDSDGNISFDGECRGKVFSGRDGAFGPAVIKKADRSSIDADNVNYLSQVENNTTKIYHYLVTPSGSNQQFVTRMDVTGQPIKYFSIRVDNGMYTPEGRVAIQGSDVRIKDQFELPKVGAWDRVSQIGIMEFNYRGNPIPQRGYLAQQMGDIDPLYVFGGGTAVGDDGNEFEILNVNDKAVLADMITVIQQLQQKVEDLEAKLNK